jgi:uncharacterized OB-fold protein
MTDTDSMAPDAGGLSQLAILHADSWTEGFWEAAKEHRLVCQQCSNCKTFRMPPAKYCYVCRSDQYEFIDLPGTGSVYTYTTVNYATSKEIRPQDLPYVVGLIELDGAGGCRLVGNLLGIDPAEVDVGLRVRVVWDDAPTGVTIPRFVPDDATALA